MSTSRRSLLRASGAGLAGVVLGWPASVLAGQPQRTPAGVKPPVSADVAGLADSSLLADLALAERALAAAQKAGASYADARLVAWRRERVEVRDDHIEGVRRSSEYGLGLRVLADGAWGFAGTHRLDAKAIDGLAKQAVAAAKTHAKLRRSPVELAPIPAVIGQWISPHRVDPFTVSIKDKADLLIAAAQKVLGVAGVAHADVAVDIQREEKLFVSSEGARIHQVLYRLLPKLSATAIDRKRGLFAARDHEIAPMLAGWEYVEEAKLVDEAAQIGEDALRKLHAAPVEAGPRTVILAPSNLWLTIHESIGHPTELDRALGLEANYAGTSFIDPRKTGELRIASDIVEVVADRTQAGGLATCAWDDDGVATERWPLIERGVLVDWQTTREQAGWNPAKRKDERGHACSYADSYASVAFQRMPNVSLQPGKDGYTTEDLINATDDGILISGRGSWSIDHQRYNFQFSGQFFWEIKHGRLTRPLRDVAYQANTIEFWNSCDMIGGEGTYRLGGSFSDGKGEPGQSNAVSHGCPPARFRVNVVNTGAQR
jgi:TldD protein